MHIRHTRRVCTQNQKNGHAELVSASQPLYNAQGGDPELKHFRMTSLNARGFTLIEVLVVVVIIAVLSAVALPQYQKAVKKSRVTSLRVTVDSLVKTVPVYYLEHGDWPTNFDQLDVQLNQQDMSASNISDGKCRYNTKFYCCITYPKTNSASGSIGCGMADYSFGYLTSYANTTGNMKNSFSHSCYQKPDTKVCQSLPGARQTSANGYMFTPAGWERGYDKYAVN